MARVLAMRRNSVTRDYVASELRPSAIDVHTLLELLREAVRRGAGKQENAARDYGFSPPHLTRLLAGDGAFDLRLLARTPRVLDEFSVLLAQHFGHRLNPADERARRRRRINELKHELLALMGDELEEAV